MRSAIWFCDGQGTQRRLKIHYDGGGASGACGAGGVACDGGGGGGQSRRCVTVEGVKTESFSG